MFLSFIAYFNSFFYPNLYVQCSVCLKYVLKSKVAYLKCEDCKEKEVEELSQKILESRPRKYGGS